MVSDFSVILIMLFVVGFVSLILWSLAVRLREERSRQAPGSRTPAWQLLLAACITAGVVAVLADAAGWGAQSVFRLALTGVLVASGARYLFNRIASDGAHRRQHDQSSGWVCAGCGRRVPGTVDVCRCGATRSAPIHRPETRATVGKRIAVWFESAPDRMPVPEPALLAKIVAATLLFMAVGEWPYSYYMLMRFVVCIVAVHTAYVACERARTASTQQWRGKQQRWMWAFGVTALLFNPFLPVRLDRGTWALLDVGAALLFVVSIADDARFKFRKHRQRAKRKLELRLASATSVNASCAAVKGIGSPRPDGALTSSGRDPSVNVLPVDRPMTAEVYVLEEPKEVSAEALAEQGPDAPVITLVNVVLAAAIQKGASDIHIEPHQRELRIQYRVDNVLYDVMQPPAKFRDAITSRIKIMANLDTTERRSPQDGKIRTRFLRDDGVTNDVDFLVSFVPTRFGEKIVMSLL